MQFGERLKDSSMGHGAWRKTPNSQFEIKLLTPYVCLVPYALYLQPWRLKLPRLLSIPRS